ncbi:MAG: hypothetical protein K2O12_04175, partial [Muribaculaceae bacterium]|nr:hypothetical protein [Muribaculaceae bacterium]
SNDVEALAQWLVLQKEAQNWGTSVATTQVVSSLLTSQAMQLSAAGNTKFMVGDKIVEPSKTERLTGSFTMPIGEYKPSNKQLNICRDGSSPTQAFGAVLLKYKGKAAKIEASSSDAVSISKRILKRITDDKGYAWADTDSLSVGDRIKVILTVVAERDMEYIVITDDRAAAFEPADQLPAFVFSEGTGFYRENSDTSTNFFISYMPKGTYLLEYELNVNNSGTFTSGIATIQSQYAPALSAHSSGSMLQISFLNR